MVLKKSSILQIILSLCVFLPSLGLILTYFNFQIEYLTIRFILVTFLSLFGVFFMTNNGELIFSKNCVHLNLVFLYLIFHSTIIFCLFTNFDTASALFVFVASFAIFNISYLLSFKSKTYLVDLFLIFYTSLLFLNVVTEFSLYNIFRIDLKTLPWNVAYSYLSGLSVFGDIDHNQYRIPTIFGLPHKVSLITGILTLFWIYKFENNNSIIYKLLIYIALITNILCLSRYISLCLILILLINNKIYYQSLSHKINILMIFSLFIICAVYVLGLRLSSSYTVSELFNYFRFDYQIITIPELYFNFDVLRNHQNIYFSLFGMLFGVGELYQKSFASSLSLYTWEIALLIEIFAKYGLVFLILSFLFYKNIKRNSVFKVYSLISLTLFLGLSTFHFSLIMSSGVIETIALVYGIILGGKKIERS